jgi:uncharacterized protein YbjT (DUF2867 family)
MKLTVFGPTGSTGEQIVRQALAAGHEVTAVARRPEAISSCRRTARSTGTKVTVASRWAE